MLTNLWHTQGCQKEIGSCVYNMTGVQELLEGKIDFIGQQKADNITRFVLIATTIISFVLGFAVSSLRVTLGTFSLSTLILLAVVVPPWGMYNKHPVKWLPVDGPSR